MWQLAIKPGRPMMFGNIGSCVFLGLPGNPVAAMVCFLLYARPVLNRLCGGPFLEPQGFQMPAAFEIHKKKPDRREFYRGYLGKDDEGRPAACKFMAAVAAILRSIKPGGTLLAQSGIYWGSTLLFKKHCTRNNIAFIEADASDLTAFRDEISVTQPDLVWIEVPSNPFLKIADIGEISALCKSASAKLAVDATAATPLILKPLALGADLVMFPERFAAFNR